jgi:hypothetical protein
MAMEKWVKARVSEAERKMFEELKEDYEIDNDSELVRRMLLHIYHKRPALTADPIVPKRKREKDDIV